VCSETGAKEQLSECEKAVLRNEFIETMKERFLNGEDDDFDYRYNILYSSKPNLQPCKVL